MSIKEITIKNYKCFSKEQTIEFSVPDGANKGTGLNILVGENNSGKTAVISAFTKLKKNTNFGREEKYQGNDIEIVFTDQQGEKQVVKNLTGSSKIDSLLNNKNFQIEFDNIHYIKDNRVWTSNFSGEMTPESYRKGVSFGRHEIDGRFAVGLSMLEQGNPEKRKEFDLSLKEIIPSFSSWTIDSITKVGEFISYKMLNGESLDIDYSLGSGILNLFRILYALVVDDNAKIVIIDEPEAYLHPLAQLRLSKIIAEKSKDKQVIIATHSPYMFKDILCNSNLILFNREKNKIKIKSLMKGIGLFKNLSPTFSEIGYYAYGLITAEFHNELYGFVQSKYKKEKSIKLFDSFLCNEGDKKKALVYKKTKYEGLTTYIRNYIHHPEQNYNRVKYLESELKWSIEFLIELMERPLS